MTSLPLSTAPVRLGWLGWMWHIVLSGNLHFPPTSGKPADVLLLIIPGAGKGPQSYVALARAFQTACATVGLQAHVGIGKFTLNLAFALETNAVVEALVTEFTTTYKGAPSAPVFLAAHSAPAMYLTASALRVATGVVFLGALEQFATNAFPVTMEFPKPVLILVGSLDRLATVPKAAAVIGRLQPLAESLPAAVMAAIRPMVVLVGLAHMCFADREDSWAQRTFKFHGGVPDPNISLSAAHAMIAAPVAAFVKVNQRAQDFVVPTDPKASPELRHLMDAAAETRGWLTPLAKIVSDEGLRDYAVYCARRIAGLPGKIDEALCGTTATTIKETDPKCRTTPSIALNSFIYSKPFLLDGVLSVFAYLRPCPAGEGLYTPKAPGLALKAKSTAAVAKALPAAGLGPAATGAELNEKAFTIALESLPDWARSWHKLHGIPVSFLPDVVCPRAPVWAQELDVDLRLVADDGRPNGGVASLTVQSPTVYTALDVIPCFAGMHYMKLWTPAQALEWLLVHGLRTPLPVPPKPQPHSQ